ncbi:ATP-binding cassette domain-containing protein [Murimonas intestini]|uniref:UvrABC system protein A n=1 Tax=Murimonas intestini TaxID=1337051 RepID=A0AB73TA38_9FIRM|nr:excinuclease ABC subunit UvrA [Murimonas intestini]MCR1839029.1 excinuclease ABC subunit UvrA [Murimonas intestini]MCR1864325.1 excinuclease ABC subunit UvrA [Murimonas intestini]MCR1881935.1 excinuclease ABC subunit UvrA [Murimonas intestini]
MSGHDKIIIKGLTQNNLKNISLEIPKEKIVVFTGVSGSGKSSIVFDTIAAESSRQMNETYPAFIRGRLPKYKKPKADLIDNLTASVIIDQSRLGGNARSTVGTISDMYSALRLLYSRIGEPYTGTASYFSFNDPNGMCPKCSGIGKILELDYDQVIRADLSLNEGMVDLPAFHPGSWYWKQYTQSGLFDLDKKWRDYSDKERSILLYGAYERGGKQIDKKVEGIYNHLNRLLIKRDLSASGDRSILRLNKLLKEQECPHCRGKRLNAAALSCRINGYNIAEMCEMEFTRLSAVLRKITDPRSETIVNSLIASLTRLIDIGLPYLSMNRESTTLSGGEAQRLKLVRYMGSSLTGMTYIFDEPSTGMHPRDVHRMTKLLQSLRNKGNTVLVVEHDKDVISIADEVIDVGPLAGRKGGQILYQGSYEDLLNSGTLTGNALREQLPLKPNPRKPLHFLPVRSANLHNLKNVSVDVPENVLTVVTGVAGSGKSSLFRDVFARKYADRVILVDQSPITATGRSTPATYLGFFDEIRKLMAAENNEDISLFSFNSKGACPVCKGRGVILTELVFMDPVTTTCEACDGNRYSSEALSCRYRGKNIMEILDMTAEEAADFFHDNRKIRNQLNAMLETGLSYLSLGQPLSTLSGGERQRLKLAKYLDKKGNIYLLDEPTTGLHASDVKNIMRLLDGFVNRGNTVIVIEHNLDVMKQADYIIDIGPDGGTEGGNVVFTGTPQEMVHVSDTITARYLRKSLSES